MNDISSRRIEKSLFVSLISTLVSKFHFDISIEIKGQFTTSRRDMTVQVCVYVPSHSSECKIANKSANACVSLKVSDEAHALTYGESSAKEPDEVCIRQRAREAYSQLVICWS